MAQKCAERELQEERLNLRKSNKALQEKNDELEVLHDVMVTRELKMIALEKELAEAKRQAQILSPGCFPAA